VNKSATQISYGNPVVGKSSFNDRSYIPVIKDEDTGDDYLSLFMSGVNSVVDPSGKSSSPAHAMYKKRHMKDTSEFVANSVTLNDDALKAYILRYARSMERYKRKHGHYPKQRIIGHSRGGAGALEFMRALSDAHPELPKFDEYIGLDPYDFPGSSKKDLKGKDGRYLAKNTIVVRPSRKGFFNGDSHDMDGDGRLGLVDNMYGRLSNAMVRFARRTDPVHARNAVEINVPGANHSTADVMMDAAMIARRARAKKDILRLLQEEYGERATIS